MKYRIFITELLHKFGICRKYKGYEYTISCLEYMTKHEDYSPVTKILYVDIAKQLHTSTDSIEHGIRNVINIIWENKTDSLDKLIIEIFGQHYKEHTPTNTEFLCSIFDYMNLNIDSVVNENTVIVCPDTGFECNYCNNLLRSIVRQYVFEMIG